MWLFTNSGFYSVIERHGRVMVRGRIREDLDRAHEIACSVALREGLSAPWSVREEGLDYQFRFTVSATLWERMVPKLCAAPTYENFKNEVLRTRGQRVADVYGMVWTLLAEWLHPPTKAK